MNIKIQLKQTNPYLHEVNGERDELEIGLTWNVLENHDQLRTGWNVRLPSPSM
jgi:hypothetical protein